MDYEQAGRRRRAFTPAARFKPPGLLTRRPPASRREQNSHYHAGPAIQLQLVRCSDAGCVPAPAPPTVTFAPTAAAERPRAGDHRRASVRRRERHPRLRTRHLDSAARARRCQRRHPTRLRRGQPKRDAVADRRARLLRVHDGRRVPACPDGERSEALLARHLLPLPLAPLLLLLRLLTQNRLGHRRLRPRRDRLWWLTRLRASGATGDPGVDRLYGGRHHGSPPFLASCPPHLLRAIDAGVDRARVVDCRLGRERGGAPPAV